MTIDFACCEDNTILRDQYLDLGARFTEGNDMTSGFCPDLYVVDGWGATTSTVDQSITLEFIEPQRWLSADFPGILNFRLLLNDKEITYPGFQFGSPGLDHFGGIVSTVPFNKLVIFEFIGWPSVDNIHFGGPGPGDVNGDGAVDVNDLIDVILNWGDCADIYCTGDTNVDGVIDLADIAAVIDNWD